MLGHNSYRRLFCLLLCLLALPESLSFGESKKLRKKTKQGSSFGFEIEDIPDFADTSQHLKKVRPEKATFQLGVGAGLNLPELFPIDLWMRWNEQWGLRIFYAPQLQFNVRVEMPRDQISSKNGLLIETPAMDIHLGGTYGPHYGLEILSFPFNGAFYVSGGLSHRRLKLAGMAKSPLIVSFAGQSIETFTKFGVDALAETSGLLTRVACGWIWKHQKFYWQLGPFGIVVPKQLQRTVKAKGIIDAPGDEDDDLLEALAELQKAKEIEMEEKTLKEMQPGDTMILPVISLSAGFIF